MKKVSLNKISKCKTLALIFMALIVNVAFLTACHPPKLYDLYLSSDIDSYNRPQNVTNTFMMDNEDIFLSFRVEDLLADTSIGIKCTLVQSDYPDVKPLTWYSDTLFPTKPEYYTYRIPRPGNLFPRGKYEIELTLNTREKYLIPFSVEKPPNKDLVFMDAKPLHALGSGVRQIHYEWVYHSQPFSADLDIPQALIDYYSQIDRISTDNPLKYSIYVTDIYDDDYMTALSSAFSTLSDQNNFRLVDRIGLTVSFVQSLKYAVDSATTPYNEYPKYPIQTLADLGGDCEDTSILLASLLKQMGIKTVMLYMSNPQHLAVGVSADGFSGVKVQYEGDDYYYIETTGEGFVPGQTPQVYEGQEPKVVPLVKVPQLQFFQTGEYTYNVQGKVVRVNINVINIGPVTASNVTLVSGFQTQDNQLLNAQASPVFQLPPNTIVKGVFFLDIPSMTVNRLSIRILENGQLTRSSHADISAGSLTPSPHP